MYGCVVGHRVCRLYHYFTYIVRLQRAGWRVSVDRCVLYLGRDAAVPAAPTFDVDGDTVAAPSDPVLDVLSLADPPVRRGLVTG